MTDSVRLIMDNIISTAIMELLPNDELSTFLCNGSKKIRSNLAILLLKCFETEPDENTYKILAAGELIHNASLLHDDVIDNCDIRRGETPICKKYSSNISVLCGDYIVSRAVNILLGLNNSTIANIFNECVGKMAIAEVKQYFLRTKIPGLEEYLEICKGKTSDLFSAILESSFIINGLNPIFARKFGELFGLIFQIKNDMDAISAETDKINGIYTIIDIVGIENAVTLSDNYKRELEVLLMDAPNNQYKSELKDIINKL